MTPATLSEMPDPVQRLQRGALIVGAVGAVACLVGALVHPTQFLRSYLFAFLFWIGVGVGCLSIVMIHHLTGGMWGLVIQRLLEAGTRTFFFTWVLFLPVFLGLPHLYPWAVESSARDPLLVHKSAFLNAPFFLGRALFYFAVWAGLAYLLSRWSRALDDGEDVRVSRRLRGLSGGGLLLMGLTITFSSVDWAMSLAPAYFSTIYGILFMVGTALSALTLVIALVAVLSHYEPLDRVLRADSVHDLGKLLLAFVMLWAYVNLSQFLITWSGNLPEEIPWYLARFHGGWQYLALLLVFAHFALPFLMLLSRDLKRDARLLGLLAAGIFLVRLADVFWLVAPDLGPGGLRLRWLDVAASLGLGGFWLALFAWQLRGRPLLPLGDPEIRQRLAQTGEP